MLSSTVLDIKGDVSQLRHPPLFSNLQLALRLQVSQKVIVGQHCEGGGDQVLSERFCDGPLESKEFQLSGGIHLHVPVCSS